MNYKEILSDKFSNLDEIAKQNQEMYKNGQPFPSIVFDNFFNKDFLLRVMNEFSDLSNREMYEYKYNARMAQGQRS